MTLTRADLRRGATAGPPGSGGGHQPPQWLHPVLVVAGYLLLHTLFFSPVLVSGKLLASSGDALYYYLPAFFAKRRFWDPLLHAGFPVAADPQAMVWYPLAILFSWFRSWNGFILAAYTLASSFTYGLVYSLTGRRLAASVAGVAYGLSGFMVMHQGHVCMLHTAAWVPLFMWSLEQLYRRLTLRWLAVGAASVALCTLAGHVQIVANVLPMGGLFVLLRGWSLGDRRWRYYGATALATGLGLALASVQLVPTLELTRWSVRAKLSFDEMVACSLPPRQVATLLFPMLFGGARWSLFRAANTVSGNEVELTGYVGLMTLMLAVIGYKEWRRGTGGWIWVCVAVASLLMAFGDATPLARLQYHVPVLNKLRAPARHLLELTLATSVLAGIGVSSVLSRGGGGVACGLVALVVAMAVGLVASAPAAGLSVVPWASPAVGVPVLVLALSATALLVWAGRSGSVIRQGLLLLALVVDLGSFGFFQYWRYLANGPDALAPPVNVAHYRAELDRTLQRVAPVYGAVGRREAPVPNLSRLWGVPSVSGYGPMMLSRFGDILSMTTDGALPPQWSSAQDRSLDLVAARYLFISERYAHRFPLGENRVRLDPDDIGVVLGSGPGVAGVRSWRLELQEPVQATAFGVVSMMTDAASVEDGVEVVAVRLEELGGDVATTGLVAGRDTADWALDCGGARPSVRHRRATVFSGTVDSRAGLPPCDGHWYGALLPIGEARTIRSVELTWAEGTAPVHVSKLSLVDARTGWSFPLSAFLADLADRGRWRWVERTGQVSVYENLRAMPRAWLVGEVIRLGYSDILSAIRTSRLPDGRVFEPSHMALVEDAFSDGGSLDGSGTARVVALHDTELTVETRVSTSGFLVMSDVYYPGWKATVDGSPARLFVVDGLLRGVAVPAGTHTVRLEFRSAAIRLGSGITLCGLVAMVGLATGARLATRKSVAHGRGPARFTVC